MTRLNSKKEPFTSCKCLEKDLFVHLWNLPKVLNLAKCNRSQKSYAFLNQVPFLVDVYQKHRTPFMIDTPNDHQQSNQFFNQELI